MSRSASREDAASPGRDWFVRAAATVGDLGSPFYAEERQRDVWNEAAAVGLQLLIWLGLAASTIMLWVGGRTAVPYAITFLLVVSAVSAVTVGYANRLGVDPLNGARPRWTRLLPLGLLYVAFALGLLRAGLVGRSSSFTVGFAVGTGIGVLAVAAALTFRERRRRRQAQAEDFRP